jgi:hypothetical protein
MSTNNSDREEISEGRRELLKAVAAAGGVIATRVLLPVAWSTPIVASMSLPAHAAMSSPISQDKNPEGSKDEPGTGPDGAAIVSAVSSGKVTLTVLPPTSVISGRTQFQVVEELDVTTSSPPEKFVRVVALMTPSADSALSGSFTVDLTRSNGTYRYQLRWSGGHTAWVSVNVKAS